MNIIGKDIPRKDAELKVTGRAKYIDDLTFPNMLYVKVLRSRFPHAMIKDIDISRTKNNKGIVTILTYKDIPGVNVVPVVLMDQPLLAEKEVRYIGEPIALIAGEDKEATEDASHEIKVEYEELKPIFDPVLAMKRNSPKIYGKDNVFSHHRIRRGNIKRGFNECDIIIEHRYTTSYQEHAYIETQGMIAVPYEETMVIYGSMQCPFYVQDAVSKILGLPYNRVEVIQTATGGAFGGKEDVPSLVASQAALIAFKTRRPAKLIYSREEDIESMSKRHPAVIHYKSGVTRDGHLNAVEVKYILNAGAYSTLSPIVLWRGTVHAVGPYKCPNVKVDSYATATNTVPCGAFRGFGTPQITFAVESQMDELANKLNMDPIEFRLKNILRKGDRTVTGHLIKDSMELEKTLKKAAQIGWKIKKEESKDYIKRGIGVACNYYGVGLGAGGKHLSKAGAMVSVLGDGSVNFAVGTTEMGQGMETVLSQVAASELGIKYEKVSIVLTDTTRVPDSGPTVASRATVMSGNALIKACKPIKKSITDIAAKMLGCAPSKVKLANGFAGFEKKRINLDDVVSECFKEKRIMSAQGWYKAPYTSWNKATGQGKPYFIYSTGTNIAKVEVNLLTGEVLVKKIVAVHDVGRVINPQTAAGQVEGGVLQGVGYALFEEMDSRDGKIQNTNFSTYILPTSKDSPQIVSVFVEDPYPEGPFGAKGLGEQPLIGVAPAITNAIFNATGIRVRDLPATPEKIILELDSRQGKF
ncbi:hypothetical protein CH333_10090 [candidate division WOR-3 bacterium JGI_Cruoil_03_44_89]|uniref:Aldehyde oxidase/xanthine dehydrogenase a/b hammerhead domain-containing protein n=1 Tax=candidate division WOR-3 bacterium JGI_Cruoil_03_44_89 TaxID=1973748 RepID=A0A235BPU7_UNCW3|nr:MAG: hypothetical protein CH333_10090 [candidate division WOR-3 bacterium JGI_Cruoil_03_44_89]